MAAKIRCGIITIHNIPNYGATFQALGLFRYLVIQGYEVEFIDYSMNKPMASNTCEHSTLKKLLSLPKKLLNYQYYLNSKTKATAFAKFWNKHYKLSKHHYSGDNEFFVHRFLLRRRFQSCLGRSQQPFCQRHILSKKCPDWTTTLRTGNKSRTTLQPDSVQQDSFYD